MPDEPTSIVVGVDGSESSVEALKWAKRYAEQVGGSLVVVTAWPYPEHPTPFGIVPEIPLGPDPLAEARRKLEELVAEVMGRDPQIEVRSVVESGVAADVLLKASERAALLVVGSRGRGAFTGMLLGSVSNHCVHHARCPVVVVREER